MAYTSREAFFAFRRSPLLTALSISTIAFALYTLSVFGLVWTNIDRVLEDVEERVEVIAYLVDGTASSETSTLMREVAAYPEVDSIAYLSKEDALARARAELSDYSALYEDLEANPLPASVEVALRSGYRDAVEVRDVATRIARFPFVEEIKYGEDWVQKLDFLQNLSLFLGLVVGGVFAVIAFVAIGATRAFIARPLVIEGFAKGVLGAVLALVLLTVTYSLLEQRVVSLTFYSPLQVVGGILLGGALGALASVFTLRRHLSTW
jgi:cell division transport system permease protein